MFCTVYLTHQSETQINWSQRDSSEAMCPEIFAIELTPTFGAGCLRQTLARPTTSEAIVARFFNVYLDIFHPSNFVEGSIDFPAFLACPVVRY